MSETLQTGLFLGVLGMGIVFLLLALLWGLMALLVRLDPGAPQDVPAPEPAPAPDPRKRAAILLAVKLHREDMRRSQAAPATPNLPPDPSSPRWSAIGRARQSQPWHPRRRG